MKHLIVVFLLVVQGVIAQEKSLSSFINPFIGTGGHGHTYPGPVAPFGMIQLSPDTRIDGSWDGCSGYHYRDSIIYGFSHTHLSGTGCSDYGDVMLMPTASGSALKKDYSSNFVHSKEKASAAHYSVHLEDDNIDVKLTASTRVGFHKYKFQNGGKNQVVLDLMHRDKLLDGEILLVDEYTVQGFRRSEAWAKDQLVYYYITFSKPIRSADISEKEKALLHFNLAASDSLMVKVSISSVDCEGAKNNMQTEVPHWNFDQVIEQTKALWNKELNKIIIKEPDLDKKVVFYTALYHTMTQPNIYCDVDGQYRGRDGQVHKAEGFDYYSVFSLWDTFRAAHPLYTIIDRKRTLDFIKTMLAQYEQGGRLPVWELACNETDCMIGYHSVSVIADALAKGIDGFDVELAFEAMKKSANWNHLGLPAYIKQGYIGVDDEHESVSKTLEYAYDDWCIAQVALKLNKKEEYLNYMKRSESWKNIFDPETGFMRPRKNGSWLEPFDPREVNNNFTEGNSWQYSFFVPQDVQGLIAKHGGATKFEKKLDELFSAPMETTGRHQVDITGLIGQYAHGNEPSHHMAFLYNYVDKPEKTKHYVHEILDDFYKNAPDGLIGNEDCGQMSAWYVLSSIGIYSLLPGDVHFEMVEPYFKDVSIHLENDKTFEIHNSILQEKSTAPADFVLNKEPLLTRMLNYQSIIDGGTLHYTTEKYHGSFEQRSNKSSTENAIIETPLISGEKIVFDKEMQIKIIPLNADHKLYYSIDSTLTLHNMMEYKSPINIKKSSTIHAIAISEDNKTSSISTANFYKLPHPDWKVKLNSRYNPQYSAGGDQGLIDGLRGTENWRKGEWQGFQSQDFEVIVDMNKLTTISSAGAGFLQDTRAWILMPKSLIVEVSRDGKQFTPVLELKNTVAADDYTVQLQNLEGSFKKQKVRYIKFKAINYGALPSWHLGFGDDAFIFVDELWVK